MRPFDAHIFNQEEPYRSIMMYVRNVILKTLPEVEEKFSYNIPFFNVHGKPMCYLNILNNTDYVDVAFVQGILLEKQFPVLKDGNNRKQVRSISLKSIEDLDEKEFVALLYMAAELLKKSKKAWFLS